MKKENLRHHKEPLKIIREIEKPRWGILTHRYAPFNNVKARFKLSAKSFNLAFQYSIFRKKRRLDLGASYKKVQFSLSSRTLILEDFFLNRHSPPKFNGQVGFFYTKGFSKTKKYYYRLIIPLEREIKFHYILEEHFFTTDLGYGCRTGTKATFADDDLLVSIFQDKEQKKHFLSIESPKAQQFEIFSQKTFAVKIALGYLTGSFAGGSGYYFAYSNKKLEHVKHFYHCSFRDTIESSYTPVYTNPFGRLHHRKQVAKSYYKKKVLRPVTLAEFSELCHKIHASSDFASALMLILESSVASLLFMPGGYAIALERISDIIIGKQKLRLAPVSDKKVWAEILKSCSGIIDQYKEAISAESQTIVKNRILQINQITNQARLKAPFDLLHVHLNDADLQSLQTRNDFLHGRVPNITKSKEPRTTDRINRDLLFASYKFYTLLNILILKWIGYDNHVINYSKVQEDYTQIKTSEEYYRKV